jgi:hypothetical protein
MRSDSLRWIEPRTARLLRQSPVIRRRSGVKKFEVDLRRGEYRLARSPLKICAVVFLSARTAHRGQLLRPLSSEQLLSRMAKAQAYARNQPEWPLFAQGVAKLQGFELLRGEHPNESVAALRSLLQN